LQVREWLICAGLRIMSTNDPPYAAVTGVVKGGEP
jgi:hypothetical protein